MDLNNLIPNSAEEWQIRSNFLMYKKLEWIPVCYTEAGAVYVFLDARIIKPVIKLVQHLVKNDYKFFFTTPELTNPKGIQDGENKIIYHYLLSYSNKDFFKAFRKIDFDLIENMVEWSKMSHTFHLIKPNLEEINKRVEKTWYDYYSGKDVYNYPEEIREAFNGLWRDIQISQIL